MNFATGEEGAGKLPQGIGASCCIPEQLTCRGVAGTSFLITCFTEHYNISGLRLFSSEMYVTSIFLSFFLLGAGPVRMYVSCFIPDMERDCGALRSVGTKGRFISGKSQKESVM